MAILCGQVKGTASFTVGKVGTALYHMQEILDYCQMAVDSSKVEQRVSIVISSSYDNS